MTIEIGPERFGFIPKRLEIEGRPELSDFPFNILFVNFFRKNGVRMSAEALYEPDFETYLTNEQARSLKYANIYDVNKIGSFVTVTRHLNRWEGVKEIGGERLLQAIGATWEQFFAQLTVNGLSHGEPCQFERLVDRFKR